MGVNSLGFEASSGGEALGMVQRFTFDLILTDIDLPLMDGLELLEALAYMRSAQGTPVVVITKHTSAMEAGAQAFIRKLFTVTDLSEKIESLLMEKLQTGGHGGPVGILRECPGGYIFGRVPLTGGWHGFNF